MEGNVDPAISQPQTLPEHIANLTSNTATSHSCVLSAPTRSLPVSFQLHFMQPTDKLLSPVQKAASKSQRAKAAAGSQGADGNAMLKIVGGELISKSIRINAMWESISSGAVGFCIKDWRQIGKKGEESEDKLAKPVSWLPSPFNPFSVFLGSDEVWI